MKYTSGAAMGAVPVFVYSTLIWLVICQPTALGRMSRVLNWAWPDSARVTAAACSATSPPSAVTRSVYCPAGTVPGANDAVSCSNESTSHAVAG